MAPRLLRLAATMATIAVSAGPMPAASPAEPAADAGTAPAGLADGSFAAALGTLAALAVAPPTPIAGTVSEAEATSATGNGVPADLPSSAAASASPDGTGTLPSSLLATVASPVEAPATEGDGAPNRFPEDLAAGAPAEALWRSVGYPREATEMPAATACGARSATSSAKPGMSPAAGVVAGPPEAVSGQPTADGQPLQAASDSDGAGGQALAAATAPARVDASPTAPGAPVADGPSGNASDGAAGPGSRPGEGNPGAGTVPLGGPVGSPSGIAGDGAIRPSPAPRRAHAPTEGDGSARTRPETAPSDRPGAEVQAGGSPTSGSQAPSVAPASAAPRPAVSSPSPVTGNAAGDTARETVPGSGRPAPEDVEGIARLLDIERLRAARMAPDGELRVAVHREGLGQIEVRVRVADQAVHAALFTDHDRAREVLAGQRSVLEAALGRQNLRLEGFSVDVGHHAHDRPHGGREAFEPAPAAPGPRAIGAIAPLGRRAEPARQVAGGLDLHA